VGKSPDPYAATLRAVVASGEWPAARMAGKTVVIKPNLVSPDPAESGATTSPEVVRALVDLALAASAARVQIVEGSPMRVHFTPCGYDFFRTYDPQGRVALVDLSTQPVVPVPVSEGLALERLYLPAVVLGPSVVFVSAAKLKCHVEATATLAMKNLFGLPPVQPYHDPQQPPGWPRFQLHERGVHQSIVDYHLARAVDFAVVDGVWGMEGWGPTKGSPVRMDLVVAGRNAVAVDRVCLDAMGIGQDRVQHLSYATLKGLGPSSLTGIQVRGDAYLPRPFAQVPLPPTVWLPAASPSTFSPSVGQQTSISYRLDTACETLVEIVRENDLQPEPGPAHVRTLRGWGSRPAGLETLTWNGRDDADQLVAPGAYTARVQARFPAGGSTIPAFATGWLTVV
jgi:uncharacterized protein (DUF362 family)